MVSVGEINLLNLLAVLALAWIFGKASERLGYPSMMGELFAGIVFGPALLGFLHPEVALDILAELGIFFLMVYVGMEMDVRELTEVKGAALLVAAGGLLLPFIAGYWFGLLIGETAAAAIFVGIAMAATSLATKSRILVDLDLLDTRLAKVLVGGALISDVGILIVFAGAIGFVEVGQLVLSEVLIVAAKALLFFGVSIAIGLYVFPRLWERLQTLMDRHDFVDKTATLTVFLLVAILFAGMAVLAGLHLILGGFMAGLFLREVHLREDIFEHMYNVVYDLAIGFFAPIFFVVVTFELTLSVFQEDLLVLLSLVAVAIATKVVGSWAFGAITDLSSRESFVIGWGMNGRGTVEIIIASVAFSAGILSSSLFSMLVFIAILTTAIVPATVQWGVKWLEKHGELVMGTGKSQPPA